MDSIHLIRGNLTRSESIVLARVDDMREHCLVPPTPRGGCHTLWLLGHLAFIEAWVLHDFMRGLANPLDHWRDAFDGDRVADDAAAFPPFDDVLATCRATRASTLALLDTFSESDLDRKSENVPDEVLDLFGTYRDCFQYTSDHWFMHRGQLADARRAAGVDRMGY